MLQWDSVSGDADGYAQPGDALTLTLSQRERECSSGIPLAVTLTATPNRGTPSP